MITIQVPNGRIALEGEALAGETVEISRRIPFGLNEIIQTLSTSDMVESRFRIPTLKFFVSRLKLRIKEDPRVMVELDFLQFLPNLGFKKHEIEEIKSEIDECLDEMAREKTGFDLDEESKTLLRNELVLVSLILASK